VTPVIRKRGHRALSDATPPPLPSSHDENGRVGTAEDGCQSEPDRRSPAPGRDAARAHAHLPASFATAGGTLNLTLGTGANTGWATGASSAPPSYNGDGGAKPPGPPATRTGAVTSDNGGKCLDDNAGSTADGSHIQIWSCNGSAAQQVTVAGDGTLRILGHCVDVTSGGTGDYTPVQLWGCDGTGSQQWTYNSSTKALVNPQSGRCLDVPNSSTTDGTQLQIFDCNGSNAQRWNLPS
jgi:hypothetical protein